MMKGEATGSLYVQMMRYPFHHTYRTYLPIPLQERDEEERFIINNKIHIQLIYCGGRAI